MEESLRAIAIKEHPELDPEQLFIGLVDVVHESNGWRFVPSLPVLYGAFSILATSISVQKYDNLPLRAVEGLLDIQKVIIQRENCVGTFIASGQRVSQIKPSTKIEIPDYGYVKGETVLYGIVQRVGGAIPKIFLRQFNGESLSIKVTEEIARKIGARLYTGVGLTGIATWEPKSNKVVAFEVVDILDFQDVPVTKAFSELRNTIGKYWDEVENIEQLLAIE